MIRNGIDMMEVVGAKPMEIISIGKKEGKMKNAKTEAITTGIDSKEVVGYTTIRMAVAETVVGPTKIAIAGQVSGAAEVRGTMAM